MLRLGPISGEQKRMILTLHSLVLAGVVSYETVLYLIILSVTGPQQTIPCVPVTQNKVALVMAQKACIVTLWYLLHFGMMRWFCAVLKSGLYFKDQSLLTSPVL
jgi:peptidoglycan biosynthesis protein MviN/MurJ (putative lipid II flippase)